MSESDKTRQKLVDSMRKTKSDSADKAQSNPTSGKTEPEKTPPAASGNKADKTVKKTAKTKPENSGAADPYQSRQRRVWPD
ncbi:hypothetical protein [Thiohalophilus sp.]|uniref:hypothetical protein n=1 Tax=Thiohalophilus sp. TaxID=3028392 RepID=UPI002ACE07BC|nr:hypothetical protein [Thiohalophilus sp.]MDZ7661699.1 hypothetical protein [Thiohalophilus sp.]